MRVVLKSFFGFKHKQNSQLLPFAIDGLPGNQILIQPFGRLQQFVDPGRGSQHVRAIATAGKTEEPIE